MGGVWKITLNETIFLSTRDFEDDYVGCLQRTVHGIKQSRRMEERYMLTELLMQEERRAGRIEGQVESILALLADIGSVSKSNYSINKSNGRHHENGPAVVTIHAGSTIGTL